MIDLSIAKLVPENKDTEVMWFEVAPSDLYPGMVEHLKPIKDKKIFPQGQTPLSAYYAVLIGLPDDVFTLIDMAAEDTPTDRLRERAAILEISRLWFTEMLHYQLGSVPMGLRILKDDKYRLALPQGATHSPAATPYFGILED
jgi:hypothetical protein